MVQKAQGRLEGQTFDRLCEMLSEMGLNLCADRASAERLKTVRDLYEPHAAALSDYLRMPLPAWVTEKKTKDQWTLLTKLSKEAIANRGHVVQKVSALMHDEHGH